MSGSNSVVSSMTSADVPSQRLVAGASSIIDMSVVERLSRANPANVQEIAAAQIELLSSYHYEVLNQAKKGFAWALVAAGIGLSFFVGSVCLLLFHQSVEVAVVCSIGGALIEFISAINFVLYGRTSAQMASFQSRLDRTQRYLIANSICESLDGDFKQKARAELVRTIAAPEPEIVERNMQPSKSIRTPAVIEKGAKPDGR